MPLLFVVVRVTFPFSEIVVVDCNAWRAAYTETVWLMMPPLLSYCVLEWSRNRPGLPSRR